MSSPRLIAIYLALAGALSAAAFQPITATNFALSLTIKDVRTAANFGSNEPAQGKQFLILSTEWVNKIDHALADERGLATAYSVPELAQNLVIGIDGVSIGVLRGGLDDGKGHRSLDSLLLPNSGSRFTGLVVFEIPKGSFSSADLRFLDDTTGYIAISLAGGAPQPKTLLPTQKNPVIELGVWAYDDKVPLEGVPPGFRAVSVDLRARSLWAVEGEAPQYQRRREEPVRRVHLLDWPDAYRSIHVLTEGDHAYPPEVSSTFPTAPRFFPEFFSGGQLTFLIPEGAKSVTLVCEMPHAATNGGPTLDLAPIVVPLSGAPGQAPREPALVQIKDERFDIGVVAVRRTSQISTEFAGEENVFIGVSFRVKNEGPTGEFFQPSEQLFILGPDGVELGVDAATQALPYRPESQVHLPPGGTRRFEVLFRIPKSIRAPQLSFHGGSFQKTFDLKVSP